MRLRSAVLSASLLTAAASAGFAQRGHDGGELAGINLLSHTTIPGAPYSAHAEAEWVETFADGNTVTHKYTVYTARDSAGREVHWAYNEPAPGAKDQQPRLNHISVYDPVARIRKKCYTRDMLCEVHTYTSHDEPVDDPPFKTDGEHTLQTVKLGENYMEGVRVMGTRESLTTAPGANGNVKPMVSTRTFWYSPELHINVVTVREYPRSGKQTITYKDISRTEPESKMFEIPAGFRVVTSSAALQRLSAEAQRR